MHPDGSQPKQLSKDPWSEFASPTWTPDGKYVIVSRASYRSNPWAYELWMYHIDGGSGVQITKATLTPSTRFDELHNALGAVSSPDGKFLYYAARNGGCAAGDALFAPWQIVRRDRKTGNEDVLFRQSESSFRPVLSPDGKELVYATRHETESGLRLRNLQTGEDRWVKYPVTRDDQESCFRRDLFPGYAFLPGGKAIVYTNNGRIYRLNIATGEEKQIPFKTHVSQDLGPKLN